MSQFRHVVAAGVSRRKPNESERGLTSAATIPTDIFPRPPTDTRPNLITEQTEAWTTRARSGFPLLFGRGGGQGEGLRENPLTEQVFPLTPTLSPSAGEREDRSPVLWVSRFSHEFLINTPLQRGVFGDGGGETVSTVLTGGRKPFKRFSPRPPRLTAVKRGANERDGKISKLESIPLKGPLP